MSSSLGILGAVLAVIGLAFVLCANLMHGTGAIGKIVHATGQFLLLMALLALGVAAIAWIV